MEAEHKDLLYHCEVKWLSKLFFLSDNWKESVSYIFRNWANKILNQQRNILTSAKVFWRNLKEDFKKFESRFEEIHDKIVLRVFKTLISMCLEDASDFLQLKLIDLQSDNF